MEHILSQQQRNDSAQIYIVIVHFNSDGQINDCLYSIFATMPTLRPEHIIIVDNLSTDGSLEACRRKYHKITYIYNTHNSGFAAAANSGARRALELGATHVLFCNPDAIVEPRCIQNLLAVAKTRTGIFSPLIFHKKTGAVWFAGGAIDYILQRAQHHTPLPLPLTPYNTEYVSGCIMCVSADIFAAIGLFDERYFLYYEDADFSVRAQAAGFVTQVVPQARATHAEQSVQLGDQKIYFLVLAGLQFFAQHTPRTLRVVYYLYTTMRYINSGIKYALHKPHARAVWWAFKDYKYAKKSAHFIPHRHV